MPLWCSARPWRHIPAERTRINPHHQTITATHELPLIHRQTHIQQSGQRAQSVAACHNDCHGRRGNRTCRDAGDSERGAGLQAYHQRQGNRLRKPYTGGQLPHTADIVHLPHRHRPEDPEDHKGHSGSNARAGDGNQAGSRQDRLRLSRTGVQGRGTRLRHHLHTPEHC